jgi:hypothetical protein
LTDQATVSEDRHAMAMWLRNHLGWALGGAAIGLIAGAFVLDGRLDAAHPDAFGSEVVKALLTLTVGLLLGGVLKLLTDGYAESRAERDERYARFDALIADMHANHDRLETARLLIAAHRSAKTYGERMREVIDAHVVLLKIARSTGLGVMDADTRDAECLEWMLGYLLALQQEYERRYKEVSNLQKYDEAVVKTRFEQSAKQLLSGSGVPAQVPEASHFAWDFLNDHRNFPVLDDLCANGEHYRTRFVGSCDALRGRLEDFKQRGLPEPSVDQPWPTDAEIRLAIQDKADQITGLCRKPAEVPASNGVGPGLPLPAPAITP